MSIDFIAARGAEHKQLVPLSSLSGKSESSIALQRTIGALRTPPPSALAMPEQRQKSTVEKLYDSLASYKVWTASVAMYMDVQWRDRLFRQLDSLLDAEEWQEEDLPPTLASYATFIRLVLHLRPSRPPGLGASGNGTIIAAWTNGSDKLTIECRPLDQVRWSLSRSLNGEVERAAGVTTSERVAAVLEPYQPLLWLNAPSKEARGA